MNLYLIFELGLWLAGGVPGFDATRLQGLLNPDNPRGIPHPTTYVIDQNGIVRWKFTEVNYKIRPTNEMIMEALGKLDKK